MAARFAGLLTESAVVTFSPSSFMTWIAIRLSSTRGVHLAVFFGGCVPAMARRPLPRVEEQNSRMVGAPDFFTGALFFFVKCFQFASGSYRHL